MSNEHTSTKRKASEVNRSKKNDDDEDEEEEDPKPIKRKLLMNNINNNNNNNNNNSNNTEDDAGGRYGKVLSAMRKNESVVIDTRLNFCYGLPKKARIAKSAEQWHSWRSKNGKLVNGYAQIDLTSVKIEGPLTLVDMQPLRADSNNFRFLKTSELIPKLRSLPRTVTLGSPDSLLQHPIMGTEPNFAEEIFGSNSHHNTEEKNTDEVSIKTTTNNNTTLSTRKSAPPTEWIFWVRDKNHHHYPMTPACFAHLYRQGIIAPISIESKSGWKLCSDEDRNFIVPSDFIPTKNNPIPSSSSSSDQFKKPIPVERLPTPAVANSKSANLLIPTTPTKPTTSTTPDKERV
jgi:hypothetical protein